MKIIFLELHKNDIYVLKWVLNEKIQNLIKLENSLGYLDELDKQDLENTKDELIELLEKIKGAQP